MRFRYVSEDHWITDFLKPENSENKVHWDAENPKTFAYKLMKIDKESSKITEQKQSQKIYAYMSCISSNI